MTELQKFQVGLLALSVVIIALALLVGHAAHKRPTGTLGRVLLDNRSAVMAFTGFMLAMFVVAMMVVTS